MKRFRFIIFIIALSALFGAGLNAQAPGLYINEVSQGASGAKEYVELIVAGTPTCYTIPTVDLRGWYIDDNNGAHATGSGTGIATGVIRFTQDPMWAAIPIGTIIVIYNDGDLNSSLPAQDISMSDGNCRLVIPVSNCTLFEKNSSLPSTSTTVYPTTGFASCGSWSTVSMANSDDSFQTVDPSGNVFHAVSWGNNTLNTIIYFSGSSAGMVALMNNATNNNISTQANWTRVAVAGNESPGAANNAANQAWICSMNNGCTAPTPINLTMSQTNASCTCTGSATVAATGGFNGCGNGYTYSWAPSGGNAATASNLCAGTYTVTVSDINGCSATASVTIASTASFALSTTQNNIACFGGNSGSATVAVSGGTGPFTYAWSPSGGNGATANGLTAGTYTVTVTDASSCSGTTTVTITQPAALTLSATAIPSNVCAGNNAQLSSTGLGGTQGYTYAWMPGPLTGNTQSIVPTATTTYTAYVTDANGCTDSATTVVTVIPAPTASFVSDITSGCSPVCVDFSDLSSVVAPEAIISWSWNFGDGSPLATQQNPSHCFLSPGFYSVSLDITTTNGCMASATFPSYINVWTMPVAGFTTSPQQATYLNPEIFFTDTSTGAVSWSWNFGDVLNSTSTMQNPSFIYSDAICHEVMLAVTSANGCADTATREICIDPDITLYVPNAFTPDGDGVNDFFFPKGEGIDWSTFHMLIFDRWGNRIYETRDIGKPWDGSANGGSELAQQDVYAWKISVKDFKGADHRASGHVSLLK